MIVDKFRDAILFLAPSIIRALTFFLDKQWGTIITLLSSRFAPLPETLSGFAVMTIVFTLMVVLFEKWLNGDVVFFHFSNSGGQSAGDPAEGVTKPLADPTKLF